MPQNGEADPSTMNEADSREGLSVVLINLLGWRLN